MRLAKTKKIYIVSDIHINDSRFDVLAFKSFLDDVVKEDNLILNGDTYDLLLAKTFSTEFPKFYRNTLYILGNHDQSIINYRTHLKIEKEIDLGDYIVIHGDIFDKIDDYNFILRILLILNLFLYNFFGIDIQKALKALNFFFGKLIGKKELFSYVGKIRNNALDYCLKKGKKFIIIGHTHTEGEEILFKNSQPVIKLFNLGCWFQNKKRTYSYGILEENNFKLSSYTYDNQIS